MKMLRQSLVLATAILMVTIGTISCTKQNDLTSDTEPTTIKNSDINETDIDGLLYMREEEKMAMDVYDAFFEEYGLSIFDRISNSESRHTNKILDLINFYGLTDPAISEAGAFSNADLQILYDELIQQGSDSLISALLVGATIEEVDIIDLEHYLSQTSSDSIINVYNNLLRASGYHLKAFVAQLSFYGISYEPQLITSEQFEEILNSTFPFPGGSSCIEPISHDISTEESSALQYVREEEKLAMDTYDYFFSRYEIPVFDFISNSEEMHTTQVLRLIEFFELTDPASSEAGVFNNPELQTLYNQLIDQGNQDLVAALYVGATIEEVDIIDLREKMTFITNPAIFNVFGNLMEGSKAHLRAFVFQLKQRGITYTPQFLSQDDFDAIVNGN